MSQPESGKPRPLNRRTLFAGAGTAGALAAAATLIPTGPTPSQPQATQTPKPERGGGYSLSEHVKQYYSTTRI